MKKRSIECWLVNQNQEEISILLLEVEKADSHPSFFQPITGGIEGEESPALACIREIREETSLDVNESDLKMISNDFEVKIDDEHTILKTIYVCKVEMQDIKINPEEHIGFQWVSAKNVGEMLYWESNKETWSMAMKYLTIEA